MLLPSDSVGFTVSDYNSQTDSFQGPTVLSYLHDLDVESWQMLNRNVSPPLP